MSEQRIVIWEALCHTALFGRSLCCRALSPAELCPFLIVVVVLSSFVCLLTIIPNRERTHYTLTSHSSSSTQQVSSRLSSRSYRLQHTTVSATTFSAAPLYDIPTQQPRSPYNKDRPSSIHLSLSTFLTRNTSTYSCHVHTPEKKLPATS